jgi:hypothetical protein
MVDEGSYEIEVEPATDEVVPSGIHSERTLPAPSNPAGVGAASAAIIEEYSLVVGGMEAQATSSLDRAYGGVLRSAKGNLVEWIAQQMAVSAWQDHLGEDIDRLRVTSKQDKTSDSSGKRYWLELGEGYLRPGGPLPSEAREFLEQAGDAVGYWTGADVHVFIDGKLALPIECKAYAEIAMLKRILVDARLLREATGISRYALLQLENMLGGDYGRCPDFPAGSISAHAILSYFDDVELIVLTLLEGDRKVNRPIHKREFFKEMKAEAVARGIAQLGEALRP